MSARPAGRPERTATVSRRKSVLERGLPKSGKRWDPFKTRRRGRGKKSMADAIASRADFGRRRKRRGKSGTPWWFEAFFVRAQKGYNSRDQITEALTGRDEARRELARAQEQAAEERLTGLDMPPPITAQRPLPTQTEQAPGELTLAQRITALIRRLRGVE